MRPGHEQRPRVAARSAERRPARRARPRMRAAHSPAFAGAHARPRQDVAGTAAHSSTSRPRSRDVERGDVAAARQIEHRLARGEHADTLRPSPPAPASPAAARVRRAARAASVHDAPADRAAPPSCSCSRTHRRRRPASVGGIRLLDDAFEPAVSRGDEGELQDALGGISPSASRPARLNAASAGPPCSASARHDDTG